jgi:hypothetical protein
MTDTEVEIDTIDYSFSSETSSDEETSFTKNGDRKDINLADVYLINKAVLTLLDIESNKYSLSIKVYIDKENNFNSLKFKNKRIYSSVSETYINEIENIKLSHMLFIGKQQQQQPNGKFKIDKTILITNYTTGEKKIYGDIADEEEYLNLLHIDYFSFIYEDFKVMYENYKDINRQDSDNTNKSMTVAPNIINARKKLKPLPQQVVAQSPLVAQSPPQAREAVEVAQPPQVAQPAIEAEQKRLAEEEEEGSAYLSAGGGKKKVKKTKKNKNV